MEDNVGKKKKNSTQKGKFKKKKRKESNIQDLYDNIKHAKLCIKGSQEHKKENRRSKIYLKKLSLKTSQT